MDQGSDPMDWDPARFIPEAFTPHPPPPLSEFRVIGELLPKKKCYAQLPYNKRVPELHNTTHGRPKPTARGQPRIAPLSTTTIYVGHVDRGFGSSRGKPKSKLSKQTLQANYDRKYSSTTGGAFVGDFYNPQIEATPSGVSFEPPLNYAAIRKQKPFNDTKEFTRNAPKRDPMWLEPYRNSESPTPDPCRIAGEQAWLDTKFAPPRKRSHETFAGNDEFVIQGNQFHKSLPGTFPPNTPPTSPLYKPTFLERILPTPIQRGNETMLPNLSTTPRPPPQRASDGLFAHPLSPSTMRKPAERQGPINVTDRINNIAAACLSTLGSIYTVAIQSVTTARSVLRFGRNVAHENKRHILSASRATMDVTVYTYRAAVQGADSFKRRLIEFTVSAQQPRRPSPSGVSSARQPRNVSRHSQPSSGATATNLQEVPVVHGSGSTGSDAGNVVNSTIGDAVDDVPRTPRASPRYVQSSTPPGYQTPSPFLSYEERHRLPDVCVSKVGLLVRLADHTDVVRNLNGAVTPTSLKNYRKDIRKVQKRLSKKPSVIAQHAAKKYLDAKVDDSGIFSSPLSPRLPLAEVNRNAPTVTALPVVSERKAVHFYESPSTGKPVNDTRYIEEDSTADSTFDFSSDLSECSEDGSLELDKHEEKITEPLSTDIVGSKDNGAASEVPYQNFDHNATATKSTDENEERFTGSISINNDEPQDDGTDSKVTNIQNSDDISATAESQFEHEARSTGPLGIDKNESQDSGAALLELEDQISDDTVATAQIVQLSNQKEVEGAMPVTADGANTSPILKVKDEVRDAGSPLSIHPPIIPAYPRLGTSNKRVSIRARDAFEAKRREQEAKQRKEEAAAISAQIVREQHESHERTLKAQAKAKSTQKKEKAEQTRQDPYEAWLAKMHRKAVPAGTTLIQPLSAEWQLKVDDAMATPAQNAKLAAISTGAEISRKDFGTVLPQCHPDDPSAWLNDIIIEAYLQLGVETALKRGKYRRGTTPRYHAFSPFFYRNLAAKGYPGVARWAKRAKMEAKDLLKVEYVIVPINPVNHWTVMVISPLHKTIEYFDSLSPLEGISNSMIELGKVWLRGELGSDFDEGEWTTKVVAGPRQKNTSDCGVFAVTTARMILFGWDPKGAYHADHIPAQRRKMVAELMKGELVEEFAPVWAWGEE
ncbi:hypothetical protein MMC34_003415 [Xylographa carneopallida]|nr:hypothetical protein [Xylographa carneopallida]